MVRVNLNRAQATALAGHLLDALENHKDATAIPSPYGYGDEFACVVTEGLRLNQAIVAEGLGVHARRGQNQGQGRAQGS
jgi:hypothetical protein